MTSTRTFRVRATDDAGAFADRTFSINSLSRRQIRFVAATPSSLLTSQDSSNWSSTANFSIPANLGTTTSNGPMTQGGSRFIAFASGSLTTTTSNYTYYTLDVGSPLWQSRTLGAGGITLTSAKPTAFWVNNRWIVAVSVSVGNNARSILTSTDGLSWTSPNVGAVWAGGSSTSAVGSIVFGDGRYVMTNLVGSATLLGWSSTNLTNWTGITVTGNPTSAVWNDALHVNGVWYFVNGTATTNPVVLTTTNLTSVTPRTVFTGTLTTGCTLSRIVYGNGRLVVTQRRAQQGNAQPYPNTLFTSDDGGLTWATRTYPSFFTTTGTSAAEIGITFHRGLFYLWSNNATAGSGGVRVSSDAINWTTLSTTGLPDAVSGFASLYAA